MHISFKLISHAIYLAHFVQNFNAHFAMCLAPTCHVISPHVKTPALLITMLFRKVKQPLVSLIKPSLAISHVKWLKFSISGTISVPIIRVMTYLHPEHPTYIHVGAHVLAENEPMGASEQSELLALLWPASGLVHLYIS
jgi:hypothetical protein